MQNYQKPAIKSLGPVSDLTLLDKSIGGPSDGIFLVDKKAGTSIPLADAS